MIRFIIPTFFGLGYINILPGTIGSLVAIPLAYYLLLTGGFFFLIMCGIGMFFLGWWSTNLYIGKSSKDTDPSEIIVDEVVGQWLSLLPFLFFSVAQKEIDYLLNDVGWLLSFILFRFFDILKPWPVNWADKMKTSLGVMLDDILAGIYAICIYLIIHFLLI